MESIVRVSVSRQLAQAPQRSEQQTGHLHLRDANPLGNLALRPILYKPKMQDPPFAPRQLLDRGAHGDGRINSRQVVILRPNDVQGALPVLVGSRTRSVE